MSVRAPKSSSTLPVGRPRDSWIDDAVLRATVELLVEVGYLQLSIAAIAARAGTTKPAIYRRWPSKAHLVHEAVFPAPSPDAIPVDGNLREQLRALVRTGLELLGRPEARAALPGLLAETSTNPELQADVFGLSAGGTAEWLQQRLDVGIATGEVRVDVKASTVFELIAGTAFVATAMSPLETVDTAWVDDVVDLIMRGITA